MNSIKRFSIDKSIRGEKALNLQMHSEKLKSFDYEGPQPISKGQKKNCNLFVCSYSIIVILQWRSFIKYDSKAVFLFNILLK